MIFDPEQVKIFYNFFNPIKSTWDKNNRRCTPALSGPRSFLSSSPARALLRLRRPSKLHLHCCRRLCRNGRWWFRHFTGVSCSCRGARTCMAVVVQSQNPPRCTCYIHIRISQFSSTGMPGQHRESASTSGQLSIGYLFIGAVLWPINLPVGGREVQKHTGSTRAASMQHIIYYRGLTCMHGSIRNGYIRELANACTQTHRCRNAHPKLSVWTRVCTVSVQANSEDRISWTAVPFPFSIS